jgi:hypothetical protein
MEYQVAAITRNPSLRRAPHGEQPKWLAFNCQIRTVAHESRAQKVNRLKQWQL